MTYYAEIDINVLVSAMLKWNSAPGNVLELAFTSTIIPLLNETIVTGNMKHFPAKPYVVTPRQMMDIIVGNIEN